MGENDGYLEKTLAEEGLSLSHDLIAEIDNADIEIFNLTNEGVNKCRESIRVATKTIDELINMWLAHIQHKYKISPSTKFKVITDPEKGGFVLDSGGYQNNEKVFLNKDGTKDVIRKDEIN